MALTYLYSFLDWSWLVFLHQGAQVQVKVLNTDSPNDCPELSYSCLGLGIWGCCFP